MKKYFNDQLKCAHAWAHGNYSEGVAGNLFFDGAVVYSYGRHFPIAFLQGHNVFFTLNTYSKTTANHKRIVRSAISHKNIVFVNEVPISTEQLSSTRWITSNVDYWTSSIKEALQELETYPRRRSLLVKVQQLQFQLRCFIQVLNFDLNDSLLVALETPTIGNINSFIKAFGSKKKAELLRRHQQEVKEWKKGTKREIAINYINGIDANQAYLRINKGTAEIETSKGIKVPFETAKRFWHYIQIQLLNGCTSCSYTILCFKVDAINKKEIKIGCHTISIKEVRAVVTRMKW